MKFGDFENIELRNCLVCGKTFFPRPWQVKVGIGKTCSRHCGILYTVKTRKPRSKKSYEEVKQVWKDYYKNNKAKIAAKSLIYRNKPEVKERAKQQLRAYRKANPEKMREWSIKRIGLKRGSLPRGTIPALLIKQKNQCVVCEANFAIVGYHMDHIIPLSKGGQHEPSNIQLLCPTCNVRKSAKLDWVPNLAASHKAHFMKMIELVEAGRIKICGALS